MEPQHNVGADPIEPQAEAAVMTTTEPLHIEEIRVMIIGFLLGLTVGGVFLIYIVLDAAKLLT